MATRVFAQDDDLRCAIDAAGDVYCWGRVCPDGDWCDGTGVVHRLLGVTRAVDVAVMRAAVICLTIADAPGLCLKLRTEDALPPAPGPLLQAGSVDAPRCLRTPAGVHCQTGRDAYQVVPGTEGASDLFCSQLGACCVVREGRVACFGRAVDVLGTAESSGAIELTRKLPPVTAIVFDQHDACVRTAEGGAECWTVSAREPLSARSGVTGVAYHRDTSCFLRADGSAACVDPEAAPSGSILSLSGSCAVHRDGSVWCAGSNRLGQLGDGMPMRVRDPLRIPGITDAIDLRVAHEQVCVLHDGVPAQTCWGDGISVARRPAAAPHVPAQYDATCSRSGKLVSCLDADDDRPTRVTSDLIAWDAPDSEAIRGAAIHRDHSICVVGERGAVSCRHGMSEGGLDPRWVPLPGPAEVVELLPLAVGFCARHRTRTISCFEDTRYEADADFLDALPAGKLRPVQGVRDVTAWTTLASGACAISGSNADVSCWNVEAEPKPHGTPWTIPSLRGATAVGGTDRHACAILRGAVYCWSMGSGVSPELLGSLPVAGTRVRQMKAPFEAVQVGAGRDFTCARSSAREVWCWGSNAVGQLAPGRRLGSRIPVRVAGFGPAP